MTTNEDFLFAQDAIAQGFVTEAQVDQVWSVLLMYLDRVDIGNNPVSVEGLFDGDIQFGQHDTFFCWHIACTALIFPFGTQFGSPDAKGGVQVFADITTMNAHTIERAC